MNTLTVLKKHRKCLGLCLMFSGINMVRADIDLTDILTSVEQGIKAENPDVDGIRYFFLRVVSHAAYNLSETPVAHREFFEFKDADETIVSSIKRKIEDIDRSLHSPSLGTLWYDIFENFKLWIIGIKKDNKTSLALDLARIAHKLWWFISTQDEDKTFADECVQQGIVQKDYVSFHL